MSHVLVVSRPNWYRVPLIPAFAPLRRWFCRRAFRSPGLPFVALFLALAQPAWAQPYTLSFESYPSSITAGSTVTFRARLMSSEGNPVPFTSVYFNIRDKDGAWAPVGFTDSDGIASLVWDFSPESNYDFTTNVRTFVFINGSFQSNTLNGPEIKIFPRERVASAPTGVSVTELPSPLPRLAHQKVAAADLGSYRIQFYSANYNDIREAGTILEAVSANVADFMRSFEIHHAQQRDQLLSRSVNEMRSARRP